MHYDRDTISIIIDNDTVPDVNSHSSHRTLLGKKHKKLLTGVLKDISTQMNEEIHSDETMSIGFLLPNDPDFTHGSVHKWMLWGEEKYFVIIDKTKIYQKGLYFWVYITGILNDRDDN